MKKRIATLLVAVVLVCAMTAVMLAGCNNGNKETKVETPKATSFVALDINPSVELVLDQNNKVMKVKAANDDASVLLHGEDGIVGADVNVAVEKIGKLSADLKYINDGNKTVNVNIASTLDTEAGNKLTTDVSASIKKGSGVELNIVTDGDFSLKREYEAFKAKYPDANVDLNKYRLIMEAKAADAKLKIEDAIKMSNEALMEKVDDAIDMAIDLLPKAEKLQAEAAEQVYELALERAETALYYKVTLENDAIGNIITDFDSHKNQIAYITYKNIELTLDDISEAIELAQEKAEEVINSDEVDAIFAKLVEAGVITNEELESEKAKIEKDANGNITMDALEEYLDIKLKNANETAADKAEELLDSTFDALEERLEELEDKIPDEVKTRLANISDEIMKDIEVEINIDIPDVATTFVKNIINSVINIDATNITKDIVEDLEEKAETKAEEYEAKVVEEMKKTDGLMAKYEEAKKNLPTSSKLAEAKATYDKAIKDLTAKADEALKTAKENRKNNA